MPGDMLFVLCEKHAREPVMFVAKVSGKLHKVAYNLKAKQEIAQLRRRPEQSAKALADALRKTVANTVSPDEYALIERIEALRKRVNVSTDEITVVDYGSGARDSSVSEEEMHEGRMVTRVVGDMCRSASKPYIWSLLLFNLIRSFVPKTCLELGTCMGISASYQASALKLNQHGKLITLEGSPSLVALAEQHLRSLGLDQASVVAGPFHRTLDQVLHQNKPVDYAFVDGHHDEKATIAYFDQILPYLSDRAMLVFDDIAWSKGMERAWNVIEQDPRIKLSVNLFTVGICVIDRGIQDKHVFNMPNAFQVIRNFRGAYSA